VASCNCIEILGFEKREKILRFGKKWYYKGEISVLAEVMTPEAKASSQRVCTTSLLLLMTKKKREPSSLTLPGSAGPSNPASVLSAACLVRGAPMSWMKPSNDASFFITKKLSIMLTHDSLRKSSAASSHLVLVHFYGKQYRYDFNLYMNWVNLCQSPNP
jgi:hypothetical protein